MWCNNIVNFYSQLALTEPLPAGVGVLNPFAAVETQPVFNAFYQKFYADSNPRFAIIGINPGRFGGGVTGIPFTDPIRLATHCGISNPFPQKQELSSVFMYDMIAAYGGPACFYSRFYITSYSPLGFVAYGKNLNYYDLPALAQTAEPFAAECLKQQIAFGLDTKIAFCLGEGKNFTYLQRLNAKHQFFDTILPLPHPRFIMQYRRKQHASYVNQYLQAFNAVKTV